MSVRYEIDAFDRVVPYVDGRKNTDTLVWRDATELELSQKQEIELLINETLRLEDNIGDLTSEIGDLKSEIEDLESTIDDLEYRIKNYKSDINESDSRINYLESEIYRLEREVADLESGHGYI